MERRLGALCRKPNSHPRAGTRAPVILAITPAWRCSQADRGMGPATPATGPAIPATGPATPATGPATPARPPDGASRWTYPTRGTASCPLLMPARQRQTRGRGDGAALASLVGGRGADSGGRPGE